MRKWVERISAEDDVFIAPVTFCATHYFDDEF